jgi:hypothetical protein
MELDETRRDDPRTDMMKEEMDEKEKGERDGNAPLLTILAPRPTDTGATRDISFVFLLHFFCSKTIRKIPPLWRFTQPAVAVVVVVEMSRSIYQLIVPNIEPRETQARAYEH